MKLYGVIVMDIVGSRRILNRSQFQDDLINYISQMNKKLKDVLTTPISITLGDEWQVITHLPSKSYEIVNEFQQNLWETGVQIYAGIGIGELSTDIYSDVRNMDGPCFHNARNAIEIAKNKIWFKNKRIYSKHNKVYFQATPVSINNLVESIIKEKVNVGSESTDNSSKTNHVPLVLNEAAATKDLNKFLDIGELINTLIENNEILKARLTPKQKGVYIDYLKYGSYRNLLKEYSGQTRETVGGISQKLNNAEFFTIQRNQNIIKTLFDYYCVLRGLA